MKNEIHYTDFPKLTTIGNKLNEQYRRLSELSHFAKEKIEFKATKWQTIHAFLTHE